jgi:hypothetical protein
VGLRASANKGKEVCSTTMTKIMRRAYQDFQKDKFEVKWSWSTQHKKKAEIDFLLLTLIHCIGCGQVTDVSTSSSGSQEAGAEGEFLIKKQHQKTNMRSRQNVRDNSSND